METRGITIDGRRFTADGRILVIAEIGTGHGGDILRAKELIDVAFEAGADCAKFQIVHPDEILHPDTGFVQLPGGPVRLYDRFGDLEMPISFFAELEAHCRMRGLIFLCTPFGLKSARELKSLNPACLKIASPELNHFPLLREVAGYGLPLILSSGVSKLADIEAALALTDSAPQRLLLHCVTSYPAPEEQYNLSLLGPLSQIFGIPVGISDHSLDPVLVPTLAVAYGACAVEKHITLSRSDPGLDDPVALTPDLFSRMVVSIRSAESVHKQVTIDRLIDQYGREKIEAVSGSGKKELAEAEKNNYIRTNRTIHYLRSLPKGTTISDDDIALLRTEKVLTPGLMPEHLHTVTGAILTREVIAGEGVQWTDLISRG